LPFVPQKQIAKRRALLVAAAGAMTGMVGLVILIHRLTR
jgi:hypothetical protein